MTHDHDPDFTNPKLNGAQPMSDTETIAEILAAHQFKTGYRDMLLHCTCGWVSSGYELKRREHRAHQAEMVAAALEPAIRERDKAAWDDGCIQGYNTQTTLNSTMENNPYDTKEEA